MRNYTAKGPKKVIQINEKELQQHLSTLVADTVQEVLNQVLDAEADEMVGAARYERSADRQDYRSGSYTRKLQTKAGEVGNVCRGINSHRGGDRRPSSRSGVRFKIDGYLVVADNPTIKDEFVHRDQLEEGLIVGRVRWIYNKV